MGLGRGDGNLKSLRGPIGLSILITALTLPGLASPGNGSFSARRIARPFRSSVEPTPDLADDTGARGSDAGDSSVWPPAPRGT